MESLIKYKYNILYFLYNMYIVKCITYIVYKCTCVCYPLKVGESNRIRTVPEYGHSRYFRNHKSYKKMLMNKIFIIIKIV